MDKMLSAKATYICYEIESRIKCNYCNSVLISDLGQGHFNFTIEISIIREKVNKSFSYNDLKDKTTDEIIKNIIDNLVNEILDTYIYKEK